MSGQKTVNDCFIEECKTKDGRLFAIQPSNDSHAYLYPYCSVTIMYEHLHVYLTFIIQDINIIYNIYKQ